MILVFSTRLEIDGDLFVVIKNLTATVNANNSSSVS